MLRPRYAPLAAEYDNMLRCLRCAQCLPVCPTYQETLFEEESPRGRIALMRAYTEGHLGASADLLRHLESCLLCEACTAVCPAGVQMHPLGVAFRAALALGGTLSGEHGIGTLKREFLEEDLGPEAVAAMRALKAALDPKGILNPHKLFPEGTGAAAPGFLTTLPTLEGLTPG